MNILVTGASGFIGVHMTAMLLERGYRVTVLARRPEAFPQQEWSQPVRVVQGDLQDPASLPEACRGNDCIIHLAALSHITNTRASRHREINVEGTENLLQAALDAGVGRFVYMSSIKAGNVAEAGSLVSPYARAKAACEEKLLSVQQQGRMRVDIVRPAVVYGPGMKGNLLAWIRRCRKGLMPPLPPVPTQLQMISVVDLCHFVSRLLESNDTLSGPVTLTDGIAYNIKELEGAIYSMLGKQPPRYYLPRWCWWLTAKSGDLLFRLSGLSLGISSYSYQTLFIQEPLVRGGDLPCGFMPVHDFYKDLPQIIGSMDE